MNYGYPVILRVSSTYAATPKGKTMTRIKSVTLLAIASLGGTLVGCGGGDSAPTDSAPTLSTAQANYESLGLASNGGVHELLWNLPASGAPIKGTGQFIVDISSGGLAASPLTNGTQANNAAWTSLSSTLTVPALPINLSTPTSNPALVPTTGPTQREPDRVVQNGAIIVASSAPTTLQQVSYVGSDIQFDVFALDGKTIAYSTTASAVAVIPLSQQSIAAPTDTTIAGWLNKEHLLANAATLLKPGATFATGSAYAEYTATRNGDTLFVGDCALIQTTTSTTLVPCQSGKTLGGTSQTTENSFSDGTGGTGKVWNLATEGTVCEISAQAAGTNCPPFGVRYWVATASRTSSTNIPETTTSYRVYFELGNNIYSGSLQRNGAQISENVGNDAVPNVMPFYIRVNKTFVQSLQSALTF